MGDAALLAHHFKNKFCAQEKRASLNFSQDALAAIESHPWPGNVREMENCIKRAVIMADGPMITAEDLGLQTSSAPAEPINLRQIRDKAESDALDESAGKSGRKCCEGGRIAGCQPSHNL